MKQLSAIVLTTSLFVATTAVAQSSKEQLPAYDEVERTGNLYNGSVNPTALWFSPNESIFDLQLSFDTQRGDLHDIDESSKVNRYGVGISGQQRFAKVVCAGGIRYADGKEYARRWNSTRQIASDNPFILGDSIASDYNLQRFVLDGTVAYNPSSRWVMALQVNYDACSSADQTDPRPKTDGMHFVLAPGLLYRAGNQWTVGVSASFDLMSESIEHAVVETRESYNYFRFKGSGDYSTISTNTSLSYPREYTGTEYKGTFQLAWDGKQGIANLLEATYASNSEETRDGGAAFTFLGGDYSRWAVTLFDRLQIHAENNFHTLTLRGEYKEIDGLWYAQTAEIDPNKNNQTYYKVQSVEPLHNEKAASLALAYRYDHMEGTLPRFTLQAQVNLDHSKTEHDGGEYLREYTCVGGHVDATYRFDLGRRKNDQLHVTFGVEGRSSLDSSLQASERLYALYTAPQFEYLTTTYVGGYASIHYYHRFGQLWGSLFVEGGYRRFIGDGTYSSLLEQSERRRVKCGVELLF
jgi:hypothetical protein